MTIRKDFFAELTMKPIAKFNKQDNIDQLESELVKRKAKIKTIEDMVKKEKSIDSYNCVRKSKVWNSNWK